ncbi:DUF4350 domain-containing protein [Alterisphingorhabdus coralli]|uniref:DUF4350 domain-containing protein n=1 Tax=Alterisphingorhabdus coralli TaxID=3071408 RepID=A0AA97I1L6_9SPHN|nr:DUF4350 domain-containing protein [Parasphingorhabdus sp. SCSIO 66989]WOE76172.1 hypothetical protein RB602_05520 [Parasphingorhabdus sp. SCSIO 66989]
MATSLTSSASAAPAKPDGNAAPFSRVGVLVLILVGFLAFLAMLYGMGSGEGLINQTNGRSHAASKSLVGYKALSDVLRGTGKSVELSRTPGSASNPGILIITPDFGSNWEDINALIDAHRYYGPTLVILPKWVAVPAQSLGDNWVRLLNPMPVEFELAGSNFGTELGDNEGATSALQTGFGTAPKTPDQLITMGPDGLYPMVRDETSGRTAIGYLDDDYYPWLERLPLDENEQIIEDADNQDFSDSIHPVILVADPDLFNNKGLADKQTALHALTIIDAIDDGGDYPIIFDLTANGLGKSDNLLTLAFRPPFLAATICFLVAAVMVGWVAFTRFAPPIMAARVIDFGKETLVHNSAATMRLLRREHLLREPYARLIRRIAMRRLNLPPSLDEEAIDVRLDAQTPDDVMPFTARRAKLLAAQKPEDIAAASAALHEWKKDYL